MSLSRKMSFNPDQAKQVQDVIFSRKTNNIFHPPLYFNNATITLTHTQNTPQHCLYIFRTKSLKNSFIVHGINPF